MRTLAHLGESRNTAQEQNGGEKSEQIPSPKFAAEFTVICCLSQ
jgi:hypothetical protein